MRGPFWFRATAIVLTTVLASSAFAQFELPLDFEHPAIDYGRQPASDPVASLNARLRAGEPRLEFAPRTGYLRPLLAVLGVPVESQIAVFSKTSLQSALISPGNPRSIFFNDSVAVAWMPGGFIEVAAQDPRQGAVFYTLQQIEAPVPQLVRDNRCLGCHYSTGATLGVPGFVSRSIPTAIDGAPMPWLGNYLPDHRTPLEERWGGRFVTGRTGSARHLGNAPIADRRASRLPTRIDTFDLADLTDRLDTSAYLSLHSDVVALLVFDHQVRMMNLLTRLGWEARIAAPDGGGPDAGRRLHATVVELVDYMLFVDEVPLAGVRGSTGFAAVFSARGPRDGKGRSLRELDLERRLLRYPCSYMVYSEAFDALPRAARDAIYLRMWDLLSGKESGKRYAHLTPASRRAVIEILRDTKKDLPDYFREGIAAGGLA